MTHVCYICHVKRIFDERARVVIYLEAEDVTRLTEEARAEGKTLVEWGRETLLGSIGATVRRGGEQVLPKKVRRVGKDAESVLAVGEVMEDARRAPFKKRPPVKRRDPGAGGGTEEKEDAPVVETPKNLETTAHCLHNYPDFGCPFPNCQFYKWRKG
jgi:hypothetical protein